MAMVEMDTPLVSSPATMPLLLAAEGGTGVLENRPPALPGVLACSDRLPRDVLVRLTVLLREVSHIRQGQAARSEVSLRLADVAAGLDALIQSIHDETALHFVGRRG